MSRAGVLNLRYHLTVRETFQGVSVRPLFYLIYKLIYLKMGGSMVEGMKNCYKGYRAWKKLRTPGLGYAKMYKVMGIWKNNYCIAFVPYIKAPKQNNRQHGDIAAEPAEISAR